MLWDGVFVIMCVVLAINGYKRGLVASWRGPIAMVLATFIVQFIYIDFSAWVTMRLRITPESAVIVGYLMLWFSIEAILEILLMALIKVGPRTRPGTFNRIFGIFYGLAKALIITVLPLMAAQVEINIPEPPPDKSGLVVPEFAGLQGAYLMPGFKSVARALLPTVGQFVVSSKTPSFKPDYSSPELKNANDTKNLEKDINNLLK